MARVLGRYHIISELGRGGMGVVYKALDPKLERFIAIKCLSEELSSDEIVVARFLREARNVAALNHPNIAQIFVADEHQGMPYFVMEYVDGESLADFIAREGQCSPEMARRVTEQSAEALAAAAEENIVHRDVKPGNIMLDRRGRAVLTDFGIACVAADPDAEDRSATLMGTPGYLPPEVLTGSQPDCRGDIFALGLVYYEMLAGQRMVANTDLKATLAQYMQPGFPDLSSLEGKVDERVIKILSRMLAAKPDERYADCRSLLEDMAPLRTGQTGPVQRADSGPSTAETRAMAALGLKSGSGASDETSEISGTAETETLNTGRGKAPETVPVERQGRSGNGRRFALAGALVLALAMIVLGVARMDDGQWDRVTGLFSDDDAKVAALDQAQTDDGMGEPTTPPPEQSVDTGRAVAAVADDEEGDHDYESALAGQAQVHEEEAGDQPDMAPGESTAAQAMNPPVTGEPGTGEPATGEHPNGGTDQPSGTVDRVAEGGSAQSGGSGESTASASEGTEVASIAPQVAAEPEPPTGVAVIGVGDPVIADPMVSEIEQALRSARPPLVDKRFIGDYRQFVHGEEIDLAGLSGPAVDAGVRYVVVARALPAGTRELQFYNRYETAYVVQLEVKTFDLHRGRELGSSPLEQIEYTSLNASERARQSVRPWLDGIRNQFN
jgi:eukaryotic-like serine/threonine-protein kinase